MSLKTYQKIDDLEHRRRPDDHPPGCRDTDPVVAKTPVALILADGRFFVGHAFGSGGTRFGEVVFNTAMTGYQEVITDPSYRGQIVTMTYPHIGNYGLHRQDAQSLSPQVAGFVVRKLSRRPSHHASGDSLERYFARHGVMGIEGIDTRALVRHVRQHGTIPAVMTTVGDATDHLAWWSEQARNWSEALDWGLGRDAGRRQIEVIEAPVQQGSRAPTVVVMDFGIKRSIVDQLSAQGLRLVVVPATTSAEAIKAFKPDGVFLSNGPGDPRALPGIIDVVRELLGAIPLFGICLGHQLLALAMDLEVEKMPFGHHGANHPVIDLETGEVAITSQNHNYQVDASRLPSGVVVTHRNLYDGSVEGIRCQALQCFSVQYHPEASPGPRDALGIFSRFGRMLQSRAAA